jgi:TolB-like protein/DNA-binding winged helix-turn-helix (wHTH) protein/Tfp pilus assembly protein PilF
MSDDSAPRIGPQVVRFGVFELDLRAGELRKKGLRVRLQEQPLQVLALLLQQPGEVVTREELRDKLWTGGIIVDFDHSLNTTINKLREALGDSADTPRFIETLPRRGYRFIYPVNGASATSSETDKPQTRWTRRWAMLVGGPLAVLLGVFALSSGGVREAFFGRPATADITSIAVLPLKNLSGDSAQDYFADGMTEALITELGKIGALQVLSYRSVAGYRQSAKAPAQIAEELQVGALLEGTVLHSGMRVRITTNLVQPSPERQLWADSYEFDLRDVLAVQGTVAREVASRVRAKVTPVERRRLTSTRRVTSEAYEAYLLGRAHMFRRLTATTWTKANEYFETAVAQDPGYGAAYAALAELQLMHVGSPTQNPRDARVHARRLAEKALQLDDTLAEAHTVLARIGQEDEWDWAAAEREYRRAIELNPSYATARIRYAMYLYAMSRFEEAVVEAKRAQQLDPVSPFVNTWAGAAYMQAGLLAEGMASCRKALELDPTYWDASLILARTSVAQRNYAQAIAELRKATALGQQQPLILGALAHAYARAGQRGEALKLVSAMKRIEAEERRYMPPFGLIWAYAVLDKDQAFAYLETSYQRRPPRMVWVSVDPLLEPLRSDPRFKDLVRRIGLPTRSAP